MAKKALNIQIEEKLYEEIRAISFIRKSPMAVVVREFLREKVEDQKNNNEKVPLILEADDEKKILDIIQKDEWLSEDEFMKEHNLEHTN